MRFWAAPQARGPAAQHWKQPVGGVNHLNSYGSYSIVHATLPTDVQLNRLTISPKSLLAHVFPKEIMFTTAIRSTNVTLHFVTELSDTDY